MPVVELLNAKPGERILDLGCGDGVLTKRLQDSGCEVVGDSSPELIQAALGLALNAHIEIIPRPTRLPDVQLTRSTYVDPEPSKRRWEPAALSACAIVGVSGAAAQSHYVRRRRAPVKI